MARFKDFGSGVESEKKEPVKFKIHGEEFECVPSLQGKVFLDLITKSASDDAAIASSVTMEFLESVLLDESLERFNSLIADKKKIVSLETLTDIVGWLIEEYTERPLAQREDSQTGE